MQAVRHAAWRWCYKKKGDKGAKERVLAHGPCADCPVDQRQFLGCGWHDEYRGRACVTPAADSTWIGLLTCPEWYVHQPLLVSLFELLPDYRRGALGNVLDLPIVAVDLLQALDAEMSALEASAYDD